MVSFFHLASDGFNYLSFRLSHLFADLLTDKIRQPGFIGGLVSSAIDSICAIRITVTGAISIAVYVIVAPQSQSFR